MSLDHQNSSSNIIRGLDANIHQGLLGICCVSFAVSSKKFQGSVFKFSWKFDFLEEVSTKIVWYCIKVPTFWEILWREWNPFPHYFDHYHSIHYIDNPQYFQEYLHSIPSIQYDRRIHYSQKIHFHCRNQHQYFGDNLLYFQKYIQFYLQYCLQYQW